MILPKRVLVVDDQEVTRDGLHALLSRIPEVEWVGEARNGRDAIPLALDMQADVVVMDVQMPVMHGIEATRRIKSEMPSVRVIILSGDGDYLGDALAAGADAFLVKGGPPEYLKSAICSW
jgi:DNA-binding NarL/FixJ family response regulator